MENKLYAIYQSVVRGSLVTSIRRFISPLFVVMFFAALIFWYVAKLSYTYTTELDVKIRIEDQNFHIACVVEGVGTNLLGYHIYKGGAVRLDINDLKHKIIKGKDGERYVHIDKSSLSNILSVRYSDIKLVSMSTPPNIRYSEQIEEQMNKSKH